MEWIPITKKEPAKINATDVYTGCACAIKNGLIVTEAVYYHHEKTFYHNRDTHHKHPIAATHWMILVGP